MKKLFILLILAISANFVFAQNQENELKLTKKERRKAEAEQKFMMTKNMLENKNFVLETDYLQDKYGNRILVNPTINFVMVDSSEAVIQIGSNSGYGPNGVGGITAKGEISNWELKENEKKNTFFLKMSVMTPIGIYDLHLNIGPTGQATADLTGLRAGHLTFDGDLVMLEESAVYEGHSL